MRLVAGLGNPGAEYDGTRHNVGFLVAEEVVQRFGGRFTPGNGPWLEARSRIGDAGVIIIKPLTYMNRSGEALASAMQMFDIAIADTLVVYDDFQIPIGTLRLRQRGTDGGHNGIASVIEALGTTEIPRLRCGIGSAAMPADKGQMADFVLDVFEADEAPVVRTMVVRSADAIEMIAKGGWAAAMNEFNRSLPGTDAGSETDL